MNRFFDVTFKAEATHIMPGEYAVGGGDELIVTTLGSCVSVCVFDPEARIGGMNHFMLPHSCDDDGTLRISYLSYAGRYGVNAMEMMINTLLHAGAERSRLLAKAFGGAAVLKDIASSDIGGENARFAIAYVQSESIPLLASDLYGTTPRKVYFWPATGDVKVRYLNRVFDVDLAERESGYARSLLQPVYGEVQLFENGS